MELMNTSLDHLYKFIYHKLHQVIPESVLAYITLSVSILHSHFRRQSLFVDGARARLHEIALEDHPSRCEAIEHSRFAFSDQTVRFRYQW